MECPPLIGGDIGIGEFADGTKIANRFVREVEKAEFGDRGGGGPCACPSANGTVRPTPEFATRASFKYSFGLLPA